MAFRMPPIEVGEIVTWKPGGTGALPAIVTQVTSRSVDLSAFDRFSQNMMIRDGVRHTLDPDAKDAEKRESGTWEYTPAHKRLMEMEAQVAILVFALGEDAFNAAALKKADADAKREIAAAKKKAS